MTPVNDSPETRGQVLARRRRVLRRSQADLAGLAGVDRKTVIRAEQDIASEQAMDVIEQALAGLEQDVSGVASPPRTAPEPEILRDDRVRFKIRGPHTSWELEVEGGVEDIDQIASAVEKLLRDMDADN